MSAPEMSVEAWSANDMKRLIEAAAHELELAAERIRALTKDVDSLLAGDGRGSTYIDIGFSAQKLASVHTDHAAIWRIAKSGAAADMDRALRKPEES